MWDLPSTSSFAHSCDEEPAFGFHQQLFRIVVAFEGFEATGFSDGGNFEQVEQFQTIGAAFHELVDEGEQDGFGFFTVAGELIGIREGKGFHAVQAGACWCLIGDLGENVVEIVGIHFADETDFIGGGSRLGQVIDEFLPLLGIDPLADKSR